MKTQAVMLIIRKDGKVLLGKRSAWKEKAPGYWCPVSGKIEPGESEAEAAVREAREEAGIETKAIRKITSIESLDGEVQLHWWLMEILRGEVVLNNDEHSELGWFDPEELDKLEPVFAEDVQILKTYMKGTSMIYDLTITQFVKMLHNLSLIIDKAAAHAANKKFDVEVLLNSRLAPDQFNFIRQIQITCDTAKLCASRISGKEAPAHEDNEKTLEEVKGRIEKVIAYLNTFKPEDFKGAEDRHVTQARWEGKYLSGYDYIVSHAVPNFYFHLTTAYSILRHNGVDVGKKDYLGELPFKK